MDIVVPYRRAILWACLAAFSLFTLPLSATGNFTISASPSSLTIAQGSQGTSKITTKISGGFNSFINLSASAVPPGITVSFNPQFIQAPGAGVATMTITVAGFTKLETYPITVTGSGGGIKQSVIVMVTVTSQGQPNFAISASPASLTIAQGNLGTSTITSTISGGFNSSISLSASGMPGGVGVSFNPPAIPAPGAGTSTMTITVSGSTPLGTYPITVTGNGGGIKQTTTVTLTVVATSSFTLSASPASLTIAQGNLGTSTITSTISGEFNSSISLSASGVPTGVYVSFNPPTIPAPGGGTSIMTVSVLRIAVQGTYPVTVTGNGGGIRQTTTVTLTVASAKDFQLSASPASLLINQGGQGTSVITSTIGGGFNNSISLSASGAPADTTVTFNPSTIPAPGAGTSTMTVTVGSDTPTGAYSIIVAGNGGGTLRYVTVSLTVIPPPTFIMGGAPSSLSIAEGNQGTSTITTFALYLFNNPISLTASGAPIGTTVSLNPATIPAPGSGASTMTITVGSSTPTGIYPVTVTGNGGGIQQSATVTLTVTGGQPPTNAKFMEPYSYALQSSFGKPPYTYKLTSGSLPSGLAMNGSGNITGSASAVGQFPFQVLATDSSQPQQQQSSNYTLNVVIGLDAYSGLTAAPVPGCNPTGYFQVLRVKGRWVYADPDCNAFYQFSVYAANASFILQDVYQSRYGNDESKWAKHSLQREGAYGFNTNDIFYSNYMLPVDTSTGKGASIKLPFLLFFNTMNDASYDPTLLGLPEAVKDMCAGQDKNGYSMFCLYTLDIMDPNWTVANNAELGVQISDFLGGFNTIPWVPAISLGDADQVGMFKGNGLKFPNYPHPAMVTATSAFNYNLPPVNGNWQRPILYAKAGWTCNAIANDPTNFPPGGSYLEKKYGTIAALNQAWGTGNFYTSFCDAGGFGTGTGVLDEDGQHTAWFGNPIDYYNQVGMNPNLLADLNNYLYTMAYQIYYPQVSVVRGYDTNHLLMCGVHGGTGDRGMRPMVAQAFHDAGCQILVMGWDSKSHQYPLAANKAVYDQIGLPMTLFYGVTAQADSDYSNYPDNGAYDADYPTQLLRGQAYNNDNLAMYGSTGSNGDYFVMGINFWGLTDESDEDRNWGFISLSDNVYNGNCAVIAPSIDQWGYPCGGEAANYGDFTDGATQTNSAILQQLILQLLQ